MNYTEFVDIVTGIAYVVLFLTAAVLGIVFIFKHPECRWRWLPCASVLALPVIQLIPEPGWSDVRSLWHNAFLTLAWSIWVLWLAFVSRRWHSSALLISLRIALTLLGVAVMAVCVTSLVESWVFLHSF